MERGGLGAGLLVQRQSDPSSYRRLGRRCDRCTDARAGSVARGLWPGEAVQVGAINPLSGAGAAGGKTALVGVQMAVDRINSMGGVNGRPIELIVADDESKPDVGRRKTSKLVDEDQIDAHCGGFLSNICLACMPVWEEAKIVNMISVCLDIRVFALESPPVARRLADPAGEEACIALLERGFNLLDQAPLLRERSADRTGVVEEDVDPDARVRARDARHVAEQRAAGVRERLVPVDA